MANKNENNTVENVVVDANATVDANLSEQELNDVAQAMGGEGGPNPTELDQPIIEGETLTFGLQNGQKLSDIAGLQPATDRISAFRYVLATNGKRVTQSQLVRRRNNGFVIDGATPNEKWENLLKLLVKGRQISVNVASISIQKSTNPKYNDSRIYTWEMA